MYGHYLTKTQIDDLTRNTEGQVAVTKYLTEQSVSITHVTSDSVRMTVTGPVSVWESALNTQFFHFTDPTGVLPAVTRWTLFFCFFVLVICYNVHTYEYLSIIYLMISFALNF